MQVFTIHKKFETVLTAVIVNRFLVEVANQEWRQIFFQAGIFFDFIQG